MLILHNTIKILLGIIDYKNTSIELNFLEFSFHHVKFTNLKLKTFLKKVKVITNYQSIASNGRMKNTCLLSAQV